MEAKQTKIWSIKRKLRSALEDTFDGIQFNGNPDEKMQAAHILSVSFPPHPKNDMLDFSLDMSGVAISGGSACSSGSVKASHVLEAINAPADRKTIRFSFSHLNALSDVDEIMDRVKKILQ